MTCEHDFIVQAIVCDYSDKRPLGSVEITGYCHKCKAELEFLGMECGVNLNGPTISPDGREARLAVKITTDPPTLKSMSGKLSVN